MLTIPRWTDTVICTLNQSVEVAEDSATLYLSGTLVPEDEAMLRRVCAALPEAVTTLRLDLHGVSGLSGPAMDALRGVLKFWRESRGGSFRLTFATERIVATYSEGRFVDPALRRKRVMPAPPETQPALTAMYL